MSNTVRDHASFLINNTRVANYLYSEPDCAGKAVMLNVGGQGRSVPVYLKLYDNVSPLELAVLDAVSSLYASQIHSFSVRELICWMSGCGEKNITAARINKFTAILSHLCKTGISLHISEELRSRELESLTAEKVCYLEKLDDGLYMKGELLRLETLSSRKCVIHTPPLLYEYARRVNNQLLRIPSVLMKSIDGVRDTDRLLLIRYYLLRRLELLRYKQNAADERFRIIWYSRENENEGGDRGLFPQLMLNEDVRDQNPQRRSVHQNVLALLEHFKRNGYIESYEVITGERRVSMGIEITGNVAKLP